MISKPKRRRKERMMSVPLSGAAAEVLRALVVGLSLRKNAYGWEFVGPWQRSANSGVPPAIVDELLERGFIRRGGDSFVKITNAGEHALRVRTEAIMRSALKWRHHCGPIQIVPAMPVECDLTKARWSL